MINLIIGIHFTVNSLFVFELSFVAEEGVHLDFCFGS